MFKAVQSSRFCDSNEIYFAADLAIDGNSSTYSQTSEMMGEHWWEAHMSLQTIKQVNLKARIKNYDKILINVKLYAGERHVGSCWLHPGAATKETLHCPHVKADRVKLSIANKCQKSWLRVYEITVTWISK